jgi:hypothetical protein
MRIFNLFSIHLNAKNETLKAVDFRLSLLEVNTILSDLIKVKEATFYKIHASLNLKIY